MRSIAEVARAVFLTSHGWATLVCAAGVGAALLPWAAPASGIGVVTGLANSEALGLTRWLNPTWSAVAVVGVFAAALVVLLASFQARPASLWKAGLLIAAGVSSSFGVGFFFSWAGGRFVERWGEQGREYEVQIAVLTGPYVALACGAALILLAAVQLFSLFRTARGRLGGQTATSSAEPSAAADGGGR
jgi:hypothetical protein